ncbi:MAG: nucleotide exchange factor GrpE [bacterium]|nr:nucleotide exchange factor GrpE [bacterium]
MEEEQKKDDDKIDNNEVEELKKQIEEAGAKCEEYLAGWKRERADFINYKKEETNRISCFAKYANEELLLKIIPTLDNIYLAEKELPEEIKNNKWTEGFLQIKTQLSVFLQKEGIEEIKTVGEKFDPNFMEVVEEVEGEESGVVVEELQRGYTLHDKVIRPAKVKTAK